MHRRTILKSLLALLIMGFASRPPAAARPARFQLVNGWILTDRDVAGLGRARTEGA